MLRILFLASRVTYSIRYHTPLQAASVCRELTYTPRGALDAPDQRDAASRKSHISRIPVSIAETVLWLERMPPSSYTSFYGLAPEQDHCYIRQNP